MANREALRELQTRLAERLSASRTEARAASWLAFECADQGVLVPLPTAGEIFPLSSLKPVPHSQPWFLGVANLRGLLHGVVDLAAFLGLRQALHPQDLRDRLREQARLLAFNPGLDSHCAVLVDRLSGLRGAHQLRRVEDPTADASRPHFAPALWSDAQGRSWQEIDLAALARHEQFLAIAAT
jgi:twitching motility protein PilI